MVVTLTADAKNWLAINAGVNIGLTNCFASSGVSYQDADGFAHTGSTGEVLNAFFVGHMVGKDTAVIIAGMDYTGFKAINGGTDVGFDDVQFAYNNDGNPGTEPTYCAPPANIISTALIVDKTICTEPCTVVATATWTNTGGSPGTFAPGIIIDNGTPQTISQRSLVAGESITQDFTVSGLMIAGSPHTICATPGTHCQSVHTVVTVDICSWITSLGGRISITVFNIMMMVSAYLGQSSLGFTVTVAYIMGAVAYYLNRASSGNSLTGCTFV